MNASIYQLPRDTDGSNLPTQTLVNRMLFHAAK